MNRPSKTQYYLDLAFAVSARSTCRRRKYGAVLVKDDRIIATGYNGAARKTPNCCDGDVPCAREGLAHNTGYTSACPAVHAECNALLSAGREAAGAALYIAGFDSDGQRLTDPKPCEMCMRLIINAQVGEVIS